MSSKRDVAWRLVVGALSVAAVAAAACSSSDPTPATTESDAGSTSASSSSGTGKSSSSSSSSSTSTGGPIDAAPPAASDCDSLKADYGTVTFTDVSADATMKVRSITASSVGGRADESLFIESFSGGESAEFTIHYSGTIAPGMTFDVGPDPAFFTDAGAVKAWAEYIEIYSGTKGRVWVSLGGGTITIVCVKNLDSEGDGTIIVSFDGIKMGVPPPQPAIDWKGSFTASGVYRHAKK